MKKIDIENWERKTPPLPKDFFAEMQENVLNQTTRKQPKIVKFNSVWYVAASLVLLLGLGWVINTNLNKTEATKLQPVVSVNNEPSMVEVKKEEPLVTENKEKVAVNEAKEISTQQVIEKMEEPKQVNNKQKMELVLNSMSNDELADLVADYGQDMYLELY